MMGKLTLSVLVFLCVGTIHTAHSQVVFPEAIQECFGSGACSSLSLIGSPGGDLTRYSYIDNGTPKFLISYELGNNSRQDDGIFLDDLSPAVPFSGTLWLSAQQSYDLTEFDHSFNVFLDQVTNWEPLFSFNDPSSTIDITLTTDSLLSGGGGAFFVDPDFDPDEEPDRPLQVSIPPGYSDTELTTNGVFPCLSSGCGTATQLNLVGLQYFAAGDTALGFTFSSGSSDTFVFSQSMFFTGFPSIPDSNGFEVTQQFFLVPEPSTGFLCGGFLLAMSVCNGRGRGRRGSLVG